MFSRILLLLPFVALVVANPLVPRSDISALQQDMIKMDQTVEVIQNACGAFKAAPTTNNALAFASATENLDNEIQKAIPDVPIHTISDAEAQTICVSFTASMAKISTALDCLDSAKASFAIVHIPTSTVCSIVSKLNTDNTKFIGRISGVTPASSQPCAKTLTAEILAKAAQVKATYSC
ncbi:hypothetical protein IW261DRAFT_1592448 [Armillaria novae-zelandiae]|uniref:Uncharacterized protein n=1 Tax=Armillaria novae-zelandiae TaxID=153914 RepID=A0AA39PEL2_9AGAR|nr:hypothetical protein IW261DRAFT_1592448 [Armillaria novae-zelandiae]